MQSIKLRKATKEDALTLLAWKNDPETRKNSIVTHDIIEAEAHMQWLSKHMKDIQIIEVDGVPAGDIRIDEEVSIKLDPKFRGKGLGYQALKDIVKPGMIAKIVNGNIASFRLFTKLGFRPVEYKEGYYILEL